MDVSSHEDLPAKFCCMCSVYLFNEVVRIYEQGIKDQLTELVGQCRNILPSDHIFLH